MEDIKGGKMIKVTYYYSACVAITTPDVSILCDPWFTDGIYDGSWYQYPKIRNPIELIGKHDIIYVSHIHPDHYDPVFIKEYLKVYPDTIVLIAEGVFLDKKMDADGIDYYTPVTIEKWLKEKNYPLYGSTFHIAQTPNHCFVKKTFIGIVKNDTSSISDIDTALIVRTRDEEGDWSFHTVVNMNDNQFNDKHFQEYTSPTKEETLALLRENGDLAMEQLRGLNDEQLDITAPFELIGGNDISAHKTVEWFLLNHIHNHLNAIKQTLEIK